MLELCHPVRLEIDTASDITLISESLWKTIDQPPLTSTRHVAQSASGDHVHITGELSAIIKIEDKTASGKVYVADSRYNLSVLDFIESLGLLDTLLNFICNAVSRSSTQNAITDQTEEILKRFSPVFTSNLGRCSPAEATFVVVKKANDSIRLCIDFSTSFNAALEDHQYSLPIPEDIFNGGTCFAK